MMTRVNAGNSLRGQEDDTGFSVSGTSSKQPEEHADACSKGASISEAEDDRQLAMLADRIESGSLASSSSTDEVRLECSNHSDGT